MPLTESRARRPAPQLADAIQIDTQYRSPAGPVFASNARGVSALADLLGQTDENTLGASDVAEPIHVLVLHNFVDDLRAMLAEPGERIVEVVHGEHDAKIAKGVHRGVPVIGDHTRREEAREFNRAVAARHAHHGYLDALVAQCSDTSRPVTFDRGTPVEFEAELHEEGNSRIERFDHDADVVHPLKRHAAIVLHRIDRISRPATANRERFASVDNSSALPISARGLLCPPYAGRRSAQGGHYLAPSRGSPALLEAHSVRLLLPSCHHLCVGYVCLWVVDVAGGWRE